jgi:hypothetical protein
LSFDQNWITFWWMLVEILERVLERAHSGFTDLILGQICDHSSLRLITPCECVPIPQPVPASQNLKVLPAAITRASGEMMNSAWLSNVRSKTPYFGDALQ